jgi:hypothetical protein
MLSHPSQVPIHFHPSCGPSSSHRVADKTDLGFQSPTWLSFLNLPDDSSNTWGVQVHGIFDSGKHQEDVNLLKTQQLLCDYYQDSLLE